MVVPDKEQCNIVVVLRKMSCADVCCLKSKTPGLGGLLQRLTCGRLIYNTQYTKPLYNHSGLRQCLPQRSCIEQAAHNVLWKIGSCGTW